MQDGGTNSIEEDNRVIEKMERVSGKSQTTSSVTGVIQAFDDYDEISKTYMVAVCISEDDLQDWMTDGVSITMSPSD
jgi:hypothetical protein